MWLSCMVMLIKNISNCKHILCLPFIQKHIIIFYFICYRVGCHQRQIISCCLHKMPFSSYTYAMLKNQSPLERGFFYQMLRESSYLSVNEQPVQLSWHLQKWHRHTVTHYNWLEGRMTPECWWLPFIILLLFWAWILYQMVTLISENAAKLQLQYVLLQGTIACDLCLWDPERQLN